MAKGSAGQATVNREAAASSLPVLIVGAGISGLLLAQHLRQQGVPFRIFERDDDLSTRGVGWGLTLHWALPAMRQLLRPELTERLPYAYVDRPGVEASLASRFPFYDLSTGRRVCETPELPESHRVRVTRERLRELLATDVDIEWGKAFRSFVEISGDGTEIRQELGDGPAATPESVTVTFDDGTSCAGRLLVACDGGHSRVRRCLFPKPAAQHRYRFPVCLMGVKAQLSTEQVAPLRALDPFFAQGCASKNDSFVYFSVLDTPGNRKDNPDGLYSVQICVSWPHRKGLWGRPAPLDVPGSNPGRLQLLRAFAETWAEPFRSLVETLSPDTEVKKLDLYDWAPPRALRSAGRVVLMGDAFHQMAMYRGEGANHAIVDVLDFARLAVPVLRQRTRPTSPASSNACRGEGNALTDPDAATSGRAADQDGWRDLRSALDGYEDAVVARARPGVLASRRACLDAHDWSRIGPLSPLLSRRAMKLRWDEVRDKLMQD
ncbi:hypothetical protein HIM_07383 [Hirsutella minnesotensis 3608]|uniref:FAD-binding domain-containing protein n=1 Tax=Hirsutella minnesotensis 3608 TaxID=1043627 RepID=A0A0F7ZHW0_9HYPO|nr:hypothetical protein HIM_07383 [Hirsutella minnesotensis 3608]